jgi:hypothetical protein
MVEHCCNRWPRIEDGELVWLLAVYDINSVIEDTSIELRFCPFCGIELTTVGVTT